MWVAKIGGSLHGTPRLGAWLQALRADTRRWLLVPGGGPYADAVRREQRASGYDDGEAHARAFAAMARYGDDLLALATDLQVADGLAACAAWARTSDAGPVLWRPVAADVAALGHLPADWRVTSDSLAHALARRLRASALLLVKSAAPSCPQLARLAQAGYVDAWLPRLVADYPTLPLYWAVTAPANRAGTAAEPWPDVGQRLVVA